MTESILLWSIVALWIIVFVKSIVLVLVLRALRQLQVMLSDGEAFSGGLSIGEHVPPLYAKDQYDRQWALEQLNTKRIVLAFVSLSCSACESTLSALHQLQQRARDESILLVGSTDHEQNRLYVEKMDVFLPLLTPGTGVVENQFKVTLFPFVYVLEQQMVQAKGFVNSYEQLQELLAQASQYRELEK